jgi:hypothetical protein
MGWQAALTTVFGIGLLTAATAAAWLGVALTARGGYRWARTSRSSRAYALAVGMIAGIVGIAGGWVVADFRAVRAHAGHSGLWWIGAAATWAAAAFWAGVAAADIAAHPQPGQSAWVVLFVLLPVFPLAVALAAGCALTIRRGASSWLSLRVSQTLFWSSLAVAFLAVPKPN